MKPRYLYAVRWPLGVAVNANTGRPMRTVHRFLTLAARQEWVNKGRGFRSMNDYRETVSRAEIESEIRRSARLSPVTEGKPVWVCEGCNGDTLI